MANYYGTARTNYFRVKDEAKFREWAKSRDCEVCNNNAFNPTGTFCLLPIDNDGQTFMSYDHEKDEEIDFMFELSQHLAKGSVAILMESGHEKLRYITGIAEAINHKRRRVQLSIQDIFTKAKKLGTELLPCEY